VIRVTLGRILVRARSPLPAIQRLQGHVLTTPKGLEQVPGGPGPGGGLIEQHRGIQPKLEGDAIVDRGADHEVPCIAGGGPGDNQGDESVSQSGDRTLPEGAFNLDWLPRCGTQWWGVARAPLAASGSQLVAGRV
jgi:hypothetical protein